MYRRRKVVKDKKPPIPDKLEDFGYRLKDNGEIRSISLDEPYEFNYLPKDQPYNEMRYDKFISIIQKEVEKRLQAEPFNFQKVYLPVGVDIEKEPHTYIYMTPNAMTTKDKVVVLIAGNNTQIGQWSKRVMCDENICSGSMIKMSEDFLAKGYEIIILNPNANFWFNGRAIDKTPTCTTSITTIPGSETAEIHTAYVFHHFIRNVKAEKVAVIAAGWGGYGFACALNKDVDFIKSRVMAVALIDSAHNKDEIKEGEGRRTFLYERCVNWSSDPSVPKGKPVTDIRKSCQCISSEQEISDFTLPVMYDDIMKFIFINMGDIEAPALEDEDEDDEARLADLTAEEAQAIEGLTIDSLE